MIVIKRDSGYSEVGEENFNVGTFTWSGNYWERKWVDRGVGNWILVLITWMVINERHTSRETERVRERETVLMPII